MEPKCLAPKSKKFGDDDIDEIDEYSDDGGFDDEFAFRLEHFECVKWLQRNNKSVVDFKALVVDQSTVNDLKKFMKKHEAAAQKGGERSKEKSRCEEEANGYNIVVVVSCVLVLHVQRETPPATGRSGVGPAAVLGNGDGRRGALEVAI